MDEWIRTSLLHRSLKKLGRVEVGWQMLEKDPKSQMLDFKLGRLWLTSFCTHSLTHHSIFLKKMCIFIAVGMYFPQTIICICILSRCLKDVSCGPHTHFPGDTSSVHQNSPLLPILHSPPSREQSWNKKAHVAQLHVYDLSFIFGFLYWSQGYIVQHCTEVSE